MPPGRARTADDVLTPEEEAQAEAEAEDVEERTEEASREARD